MEAKKTVFWLSIGSIIVAGIFLYFIWSQTVTINKSKSAGNAFPNTFLNQENKANDAGNQVQAPLLQNSGSFSQSQRSTTQNQPTYFKEPGQTTPPAFVFNPANNRSGLPNSSIGQSNYPANPQNAILTESQRVNVLYSQRYIKFLSTMQDVMVKNGFMAAGQSYAFDSDADIKNFLVNYADWMRKKHTISSQEWRNMLFGMVVALPKLQKNELDYYQQNGAIASNGGLLIAENENSFKDVTTDDIAAAFDKFLQPLGPGAIAADVADVKFGQDILKIDITIFQKNAFTEIMDSLSSIPENLLDAQFKQVGSEKGKVFTFLKSFFDTFSIKPAYALAIPGECWRSGGPPIILGKNLPILSCKAGLYNCGPYVCYTNDCEGPFGEQCTVLGLGCINFNSVICPGEVGMVGAIWDEMTGICGCGI